MLDSDGRSCSEYHISTLNVSSYCQPRPSISKPIQLSSVLIADLSAARSGRVRLFSCLCVQLIVASSPLEGVRDADVP